jgi:uncharacterized membrane protein YhfC
MLINIGAIGALSGLLPADRLESAVRTQLVGTPSYMFLLGGVERVFTIALHIALSVLLMSFVMKGRSLAGFVTVSALHAWRGLRGDAAARRAGRRGVSHGKAWCCWWPRRRYII